MFSCDAPGGSLAPVCLLDDLDEVVLGRDDAAAVTAANPGPRQLRIGFADQWMSARHARLQRVVGGFLLIDEGSKNGLRLNGERTPGALLVDGDWIEVGHTVLRYRWLPSRTDSAHRCAGAAALVTSLPVLAERAHDLEEIARSTVSVVLRGETGTGKEVLARSVHRLSGRPGDLVAVNCGALPATLLESELFGHRKGAFSNAIEDRPGLVRAADGGTLFLDEIGDLPTTSQAALLRVLQEREVTPIGSTHPIKVDLRVICATHRDLEAQVARGELRGDLYARLAGYTFAIPPLRERLEDLGLLTAALLDKIAPGREVRFAPDAVRALYRHAWPLNVRELEKCLASAVVLARSNAIDGAVVAASLGPAAALSNSGDGSAVAASLAAAPAPATDAASSNSAAMARVRRAERRQQLIDALVTHRGNISAIARALGKARSQIQRWLHDDGIDPAPYRDP